MQIAAPAARTAGHVLFELAEPPDGITVQKSSAGSGDTVTVTIACDAAKLKPGTQGNLLLTGFGERPTGKAKVNQRSPLGAVPAIPFEIVGPPRPSA